MALSSNYNTQDPNHPVSGGYLQPSSGVTFAAVAQYRDGNPTVQNSATSAAPTAGTAVATLTTPAAGTYEITGTVAISGTTVVATDSHNFNLKKGATTLLTNIPYPLTGTTGSATVAPFGPVIVTLDGSTSVTVNAVASATASSVYAASLVGRLVG